MVLANCNHTPFKKRATKKYPAPKDTAEPNSEIVLVCVHQEMNADGIPPGPVPRPLRVMRVMAANPVGGR